MIEIGNVEVTRTGISNYEIKCGDYGKIKVNPKMGMVRIIPTHGFIGLSQQMWDIANHLQQFPKTIIEFYRTYSVKRWENR